MMIFRELVVFGGAISVVVVCQVGILEYQSLGASQAWAFKEVTYCGVDEGERKRKTD